MNKSILLSKVFWFNLLALVAMAFPAVSQWLAANPEKSVAVLAALNVLLRFVTSGRVSLTGNDSQSGGTSVWLVFACMAGTAAVGTLLPSCSPAQLAAAQSIPIKACVITEQGTVCYSSKSGLSAEIDARSAK